MTFNEAILDAAHTVKLLRKVRALAKDIGADLRCGPTWGEIEMEIRQRLYLDFVCTHPMPPTQFAEWSRLAGWS